MCAPGSTSTLFLNFGGGSYTPGPDDATTNTAALDMARTLAPWTGTATSEILDCMEAGLAPFNIRVTDVDPGTTPHHETVFTSDVYWYGAGAKSLATVCQAGTNSVTFAFGPLASEPAQAICDIALASFAINVAQLSYTTDCHDIVSQQTGCGPKTWASTPVPCGDDSPQPCFCGGTEQSSLDRMLAVFGPHCE